MIKNNHDGAPTCNGLWPGLVQFWIAASIFIFSLIRVLGSQTAQRLLDELQHRHRL